MSPNEPNDPEQTRPIPSDSDPTRPVRLPGQGGAGAAGGGSVDRSEDPTASVPPGVAPHDLPVQKPKIYVDPAYGQGTDPQATRALPAQQYNQPQYGASQYGASQYGGAPYERDPYEQAAYEQGRYEAGPEDPVRSIWWPIAVIMASLAIVGAVGGYLWASRDNNSTPAVTNSLLPTATATSPTPTQTSTEPSPAPTSSETSTSQSPTTTSSSTSPTTSSSTSSETSTSTAAGTFPAGAKVCAPTVGGNARASCGFATNVAAAAAGPISDGQAQFQVTAHSPATGRDYTLNCVRTDLVTCSTDTGAEVYLLVS